MTVSIRINTVYLGCAPLVRFNDHYSAHRDEDFECDALPQSLWPTIYLFIIFFFFFGHPSITIYNYYYHLILFSRCFFFMITRISAHLEPHLSAYYDLYWSDTIYLGLSITRYPLHQGWLISSKSTTHFYLSEIFALKYIYIFTISCQ